MFKNKKEKSIVGYSLLAYLLAFIGAVILSPVGGWVYSKVFNVYCDGSFFILPGDKNCALDGFIYLYPFLMSMIIVIFFHRLKLTTFILSWLIGASLLLLLEIFVQDWSMVLSILILGGAGYLFGQAILKIKNK